MTLLYILLALAVLLVMITVHEFGHYCAGKIFGFKINEFSIGFGPAIYKKTKKDGEIFSVRALPLGGYCAFEGEDEEGKSNPDAMNNKPAWKRLIVLLSGVTFNFFFGVLTAAIYLMVTGFAVPKISQSLDSSVLTGSGLQTNDVIVAVDGKTVEAYRSFSDLVKDYKENEEFVLTVNRDGKIIDVKSSKRKYDAFYYVSDGSVFVDKLYKNVNGEAVSVPYQEFLDSIMQIEVGDEGENKGKGDVLKAYLSTIYKDDSLEADKAYTADDIAKFLKNRNITFVDSGVSMGIVYVQEAQEYGFFESIAKAFPFCFYLCGLILSALGGLFTGATALKDMGGTVTAVSQIAEISQMGIGYFLLLLPLLAMNLALFNVLPIPSLDGARAVFVLIEMIFRKPVNRKVEAWIHTIGLFLLLGLVIFFDVYHFAFASCFLIS